MKEPEKIENEIAGGMKKRTSESIFSRYMKKLKKGPLTCPVCREVFHGMSELGSHMKIHCT